MMGLEPFSLREGENALTDTITVALISAGGSVLVAITALILSYRGFASIDSRFASIDSRFASIDARFDSVDGRFASIERRLDAIQADLKEFYRLLADHDKRLSKLEDK